MNSIISILLIICSIGVTYNPFVPYIDGFSTFQDNIAIHLSNGKCITTSMTESLERDSVYSCVSTKTIDNIWCAQDNLWTFMETKQNLIITTMPFENICSDPKEFIFTFPQSSNYEFGSMPNMNNNLIAYYYRDLSEIILYDTRSNKWSTIHDNDSKIYPPVVSVVPVSQDFFILLGWKSDMELSIRSLSLESNENEKVINLNNIISAIPNAHSLISKLQPLLAHYPCIRGNILYIPVQFQDYEDKYISEILLLEYNMDNAATKVKDWTLGYFAGSFWTSENNIILIQPGGLMYIFNMNGEELKSGCPYGGGVEFGKLHVINSIGN
jgi:hypothetical protein